MGVEEDASALKHVIKHRRHAFSKLCHAELDEAAVLRSWFLFGRALFLEVLPGVAINS